MSLIGATRAYAYIGGRLVLCETLNNALRVIRSTLMMRQLAEGCTAHWKRYDKSVAELTDFNTTNSSWDWTSASPYSCDKDNGDYKYSWCESGRYIPPQVQYKSMVWLAGLLLFWWIQCENNPDCVDVLMNR